MNRDIERNYKEMKLTYRNLVNANTELVDRNKLLEDENYRYQKVYEELEDYIFKVEMFASVDKVNILSLKYIKDILYKIKDGDKE